MAEFNLPLRLTIDTAHVRAYQNGKEVLIEQSEEVQNDAACLYQVLNAIDGAVEKYKTQRQRIKKLRRLLRPVVRVAEKKTAGFDGVVGEIMISDDALQFIVDVFDSPPEGVVLRGASVDTAEDMRDLNDELKRAKEPKE